jgi:hypothetical protein
MRQGRKRPRQGHGFLDGPRLAIDPAIREHYSDFVTVGLIASSRYGPQAIEEASA